MRLELSKRIFLNFVVVIAGFCILGALLGASLINRNILNEAQRRVRLNLRSGWSVIHSEIDQIGLFVSALVPGSRVAKAYGAPESQTSRASLEAARQKCGFVREEKNFRFEIWNDGNGLSPDKTARLFGKFVRFNQETDTSRSAGLGLFITREIITKHGGKIWVESEEGKWINFLFTLPKGEQKNG